MKNQKGFTLIEIMLVATILGIIIAVAYPFLMKHTGQQPQLTTSNSLGVTSAAPGAKESVSVRPLGVHSGMEIFIMDYDGATYLIINGRGIVRHAPR